ncbi:MAG: glycosyltransferase family 4 protein [Minisyncoccales bacterium]
MQKVKKIKICYVTNIDKSVKFILFNQLKFLKNEGYKIFAVCSNGKFIKDIEKQGIKIKIINFKRKISPISDLICLFKLFFYFKKEKFALVHTHTPKPGLLGQLAAKFAGVPIIINTIHGFYFQGNSSFLKRKFFIFIEKISAKCSNLIFFVNKEDMDTVAREKICNSDLIKYLGGGIDLSRFNSDRFSEEFILIKRKELGIGSEKKVIGIVARLVREKGYLDIFKAFKKVLKIFPETTLLIIGPLEPEKKDAINPDIIKNYDIEKNVLFLGEREDVEEIYLLMDIFVLPSWREGLGISILEASAMKKPVIATDIRGCREAVDDGKTGILVPVRNPEKLAEAIIYLLENPEKAKKMSEEGRERAEKEFDERLVFDRIKTEYQRLIKEKL